jgi:molecular chaperone DnaK (HSP70)
MSAFHVGIDLGTTNCALASVRLGDPSGRTTVLPVTQRVTAHSSAAHQTLPSFLHLPADGDWVAGRWARSRAPETPGRVVSSAKSWLVHHAADRRAKFLPFGSRDLSPETLLSPVEALAALLGALASAWNTDHPSAPLAAQSLAITVPASFDPAAQQLTLEAASLAGFPSSTILLEEPQAAFYSWLENVPDAFDLLARGDRATHVLVVDIGGGTTDLSLFSVESKPDNPIPRLQRVAVSDHILLGGDNLDLALAHFAENKLSPGSQLPPTTFAQLLARCRDIKEEALAGTPDPAREWTLAVAKPGASLLGGTLQTTIGHADVASILLDGFLPAVGREERPLKAAPGLREMGLPYAKDPAITRHIADFLRGRPPVDFVLFNGGQTKAAPVRDRILAGIAAWQPDLPPRILDNPEPDLAVARGAARFLHLRETGDASRIEAGASHAYYIEVGNDSALCVLPQDAPPETLHQATLPGLKALVGKPATFSLLRNPRRPSDREGDTAPLDSEGFTRLPPVETILSPPQGERPPSNPMVHVGVQATLRSTGLLRVELLCDQPGLRWDRPWPLEFSLRGTPTTPRPRAEAAAQADAAPDDQVAKTAAHLTVLLDPSRKTRQKPTANVIFQAGEKMLATPKARWSGGIVRRLFDSWMETADLRKASAAHEETWLHLAGWLLRPGRGMIGDPARIDALAPLLAARPVFPSGAVRIQRWIAARRIAAGLDADQAAALWHEASAEWKPSKPPPAEIALLAGALESLHASIRFDAARRLSHVLAGNPSNPAHWKALGRLLSRVLFHAGAEQILTPDLVAEIWERLERTDPGESLRPEAATAWLRAARLTGLRPVDVDSDIRSAIDARLRKWDIPDPKRRVLHEIVPLAPADQTGLLGDAPPPGLTTD